MTDRDEVPAARLWLEHPEVQGMTHHKAGGRERVTRAKEVEVG